MTLRYSIISGSVKTVPPKFFAKWEAANGLCCVCATDLPKAGETFTKNRAPTGCEAVFLMAVNLRLGHVTRDGDTPNKRTKMRKARRVFSKQRRAELARIMQDECS